MSPKSWAVCSETVINRLELVLENADGPQRHTVNPTVPNVTRFYITEVGKNKKQQMPQSCLYCVNQTLYHCDKVPEKMT
jgi:hypothetical protein